jgi:hypothetical protein
MLHRADLVDPAGSSSAYVFTFMKTAIYVSTA